MNFCRKLNFRKKGSCKPLSPLYSDVQKFTDDDPLASFVGKAAAVCDNHLPLK